MYSKVIGLNKRTLHALFSIFVGRHTVEILYAGQAIMGSPFYVEIYDPNKIRVEGIKNGFVGESIGFDSKWPIS